MMCEGVGGVMCEGNYILIVLFSPWNPIWDDSLKEW